MKFEFSAGGIVIKKSEIINSAFAKASADKHKSEISVLVCQHSQHHGWVFPKGLIGDHIENEQKEETAIREVEEETGARGKIIKALTPVEFYYVFRGEKIKKTVYYFLMESIGGDITKHDFEMENVEWLPESEVEKRLTYDSDKKVWSQARELIANSV
jgi:8-oxo-dGTP pyrophosphatase MutT (NUDIX family)